jgi:hypothetical protein
LRSDPTAKRYRRDVANLQIDAFAVRECDY